MKRPLILSLAIAFAFHGSAALALGLGPVHVKSKLNQPLDAEIPVIQGSVDEAAGLVVQLASGEDFDRVGLDRSRISVPLEFTLVRSAGGEPVIRVTSKEPIREPFLDFLVEANWPKGRLLREYTVLLDPPVMAPVRAPAPVVARQETAPATTTTTKPLASRPAPRSTPSAPAAPPRSVAKPASPAAPATATAKRAAAGEYGPVASGETLWDIARANRGDGAVSLNRMMLALLRANPQAFADGNINALKRGAILRMPSEQELAAVGSGTEIAAEVGRQAEAWRNARGIAPTRVATSAPAPVRAVRPPADTAASKPKPRDTERLALVPPRAGEDSLAANGAPGAATGAAGETRAELARTKEALSSTRQESEELKSRVTELEQINDKSERLIGLKNSEIADLQRQLEALRKENASAGEADSVPDADSSAPTVVTPEAEPEEAEPGEQASAPAAAPVERDIWGNPQGTSTAAPVENPAAAPGTEAPATDALADSDSATSAADAATTAAAPMTSATAPPTTAAPAVVTTPNPPVAQTGAVGDSTPTPVLSTRSVPPDVPWYKQGWVRIAALLGAVLLVLFGLLGLRRRKPVTATPRTSIAGAFGDHPPVRQGSATPAADSASTEEEILRRQLVENPEDVGLHLELLSLYYADNDVAAFEVAAQEMATHVGEGDQLEWQQVRAMGAELAPHNPLFVDAGDVDDGDGFAGFDGAEEEDGFDIGSAADASAASTYDADATLRFPTLDVDAEPQGAVHSTGHDTFEFDVPAAESTIDLPELPESVDMPAATPPGDLDFDWVDKSAADSVAAESTTGAGIGDTEEPAMDNEFLASEDAIGTKLDLARAYLDMGDPDGARAMLEEVLGEGNPDQQDEARRLIAEIR